MPNVPVAFRDFTGKEISRVYADQWGDYNGVTFSSWTVNPPSPSGYTPNVMIACMNDPGPIPDPANPGQMITDPAYNPAYSNFCYEWPFMPGLTAHMDTPVVPTMAFAAGYNLPDCEYPDATPAIKEVNSATDGIGPWVAGANNSSAIASVTLTGTGGSGYTSLPTVDFTGGGSGATASLTGRVSGVSVTGGSNTRGTGYTGVASVSFSGGGGGSGAAATAFMRVGSVTVVSPNGSYTGIATPAVTIAAPGCVINGTTCVQATGTATMSSNNLANATRRVTGINFSNNGSGYTSPPAITFSTGPATATARLSVQSVSITAGGSLYTTDPNRSLLGAALGHDGTRHRDHERQLHRAHHRRRGLHQWHGSLQRRRWFRRHGDGHPRPPGSAYDHDHGAGPHDGAQPRLLRADVDSRAVQPEENHAELQLRQQRR